jgi:hypothetical protein
VSDSKRDPAHVRTYRDAEACFSMARSLWQDCPTKPSAEALQATFATLMIHTKDVRNPRSPGQAPAAQIRPRTQQPAARRCQRMGGSLPRGLPDLCGGAIYDNRKDGPDKPQWRCKNKECKDEKGYQTSEWSFKKKGQRNTAYAQAHADRPVPQTAEDYVNMPQGLEDDDPDSDLPF